MLVDLRVDRLSIRFSEPLRLGDRMASWRELALVRLIAEDGTSGVGELALDAAGGQWTAPATFDRLRRALIGAEVENWDDVDERMSALLGQRRFDRAIRAAIDTASLDLVGRLSATSAGTLLGGRRSSVPVNAVLAATSDADGRPEGLGAAARSLVQGGFTTLKIKREIDGPDPIETIRAVRDAVGSEVRLRLDLNGDLAEDEAVRMLPALAEFDLEYVEQPIDPSLGAAALARVRHAVGIPIAADEAVEDPAAAAELLASGAADVLVVKPTRVGGPRTAIRIARAAADAGVRTTISTFYESGIGLAAALHAASAIAGDNAHGLATGALLEDDLIVDALAVIDGQMPVPPGPGLGVEVDPEAVERLRVPPVIRTARASGRAGRANEPSGAAAPTDPVRLQVSRQGKATAVEDVGLRWSWSTLDEVANRVAGALAARGITEGDRVAVVAEDAAPFVAFVHGVRRVGAVLVPLSRRATVPELTAQLVSVRASAVAFDRSTAPLLTSLRHGLRPLVEMIQIEDLIAGSAEGPAEPRGGLDRQLDPNRPATIILTSGSAGRPRAAVLTYANHETSAEAWAGFLEPRSTDRWLGCLPFNHVGGLSLVHRSALWGVPLQLVNGFDPDEIWRAIDRDGISHISIVGSTLRRLVEATRGRTPPDTLRAILAGGESTPPDDVTAAMTLGLPIVLTYGSTETASGVTALSPSDWVSHRGSSGRALPGVELRIGGSGAPAEQRTETTSGASGEIHVRGPMVFSGYDDGGPSPVDDDGWLATGDEGVIDDDGFLTVLGRRDGRIISGGENIDPLEIEAALRTHPAIEEALVVGRPDERWGQVAVATVVVGADRSVSDEELASFLRQRLAPFKVPKAFDRVDRLPRSASGKLVRRSRTRRD